MGAGESIESDFATQGDGLSAIEFPYGATGRAARLRVTVSDPSGGVLEDQVFALEPTLDVQSRLFYWEVTYWGPVVHYERIPVAPPPGTRSLHLRLQVLPGSPVVAVYQNALDASGQLVAYPEAGAPVSQRLTIRTLYGPIQPGYLEWQQTAERMSRIGPPWLPYPAAPALVVLLIIFAAALVGLMAASPEPADEPDVPTDLAASGSLP